MFLKLIGKNINYESIEEIKSQTEVPGILEKKWKETDIKPANLLR